MSLLIHIGYPKCGSSLIRKYLNTHPQVYFKKDSIMGFQVPEDISKLANLDDNKIKCYAISEEDLSFWPGEYDPVGLKLKPYNIKSHQKKVCHILHELFPTAKILIITRGFASVIRSAYSQYLKAGGIEEFRKWFRSYENLLSDFFDYQYLIDLYRSTFRSGNVLVLPFEMLGDNKDSFFKKINSHVELDFHNPPEKVINKSLLPKEMSTILALNRSELIKLEGLSKREKQTRFLEYLEKERDINEVEALEMDLSYQKKELEIFIGKAKFASQEEIFLPYQQSYKVT